jgi:hypothetical protein
MEKDDLERQCIREEILTSLRMSDFERLQWLEEIVAFSKMFQSAPELPRTGPREASSARKPA